MELHTIGIDLGKTVFHLVGLKQRGEVVDHTTVRRWVQYYGPELTCRVMARWAKTMRSGSAIPTSQFGIGIWRQRTGSRLPSAAIAPDLVRQLNSSQGSSGSATNPGPSSPDRRTAG